MTTSDAISANSPNPIAIRRQNVRLPKSSHCSDYKWPSGASSFTPGDEETRRQKISPCFSEELMAGRVENFGSLLKNSGCRKFTLADEKINAVAVKTSLGRSKSPAIENFEILRRENECSTRGFHHLARRKKPFAKNPFSLESHFSQRGKNSHR